MKVALVHDYIKEYGGAEKVLEALHEVFPDAPVFTSVYLPQFLGPHRERFATWDIRPSFLQHIPFAAKLISPFRLFSQAVFQSFDFTDFDVIIVSATGAYLPNSLQKKRAKLLCYCHTPPRYLYGYATARDVTKNPYMETLAHIANHFLRMQDFHASKNVDVYIANSEEVAGRIKKFYRRDSRIVYPPAIESRRHKAVSNKKNKNNKYYLAGGRLARAKHIDVIVQACLELNLPLKIFGKSFAGYGNELESLAKSKGLRGNTAIEFLGEVPDAEKWNLYAGADALLFASEDEDFGIMPVESMAVGTPVIAYRSGGVQETVKEGKTGLFYDKLSAGSLMEAIKRFEQVRFSAEACVKQAEKFSKERFMRDITKIVEQTMNAV